MFLAWLHGSGNDVLLRMVLRLFLSYLANLHEVVDQRMVLRTEHDASRRLLGCRAQLIDTAVADMCHGSTIGMKTEEGEGCSHLALLAVVFRI